MAKQDCAVLEKSVVVDFGSASVNKLWSCRWHSFCDARNKHQLTCISGGLEGEFLSRLAKMFVCSNFAFEYCLKNPDTVTYLYQHPDFLTAPITNHSETLAELLESVATEEALMHTLRTYRNREMVRIIWRDVNGLGTLEEATLDLSLMADACIDHALDWLYRSACERYGTPMGGAMGEQPWPQRMVVIGMGKLGAYELNLSSDIDLIFAYPRKGETSGAARSIDNQTFFTRLGQQLIHVLDSRTAEGFVFRVDMRLRPYGGSGPLVSSFAAMEQYYQDQGRDWERYAMIKARVCAGDLPAGSQLMASLVPFTFRRYIDFSAIESLREMKRTIQREVRRKGMESNIKLGPGGIREIEFVIQVFQLIHGGRHPRLQQRALLVVTEDLSDEFLPSDVVRELTLAYQFLRRLEHALQALDDSQTQTLPEESLKQSQLALYLGFSSWSSLLEKLREHRDRVVGHFENVIYGAAADESDVPVQTGWSLFWQGRLTEEEEQQQLNDSGFFETENAWRLITQLRDGQAVGRMRRVSRERLDRFMPIFLQTVASRDRPRLALERTLPIVESVLRRTVYLVLLIENPSALEHLTKLCTASSWIAGLIARYPALLDEFLNLKSLYTPPQRSELELDLRQQLMRIPEDDLEAQMEALRHFRMSHALRVAAAQVAGTLALMKESDYLTWLAEVILAEVLRLAWRTIVQRHGHPESTGYALEQFGFTVVGYGKLGGIELGPASDLDLVFIHNSSPHQQTNGTQPIDCSTFYTRLGQRIIHILSTSTASGKLYEVDMRLRPSGDSGMLVSSLESFAKYQLEDAWTWEHQALVRARAVAGDPALGERFEEVRKTTLQQKREHPALRAEVIAMRDKMQQHRQDTRTDSQGRELSHVKYARGGIIDIEFLMQYAVLAFASQHETVVKYTDNIRISESLEKARLLGRLEGEELRLAYTSLRQAAHRFALDNEDPWIRTADALHHFEMVQRVWAKWLGV